MKNYLRSLLLPIIMLVIGVETSPSVLAEDLFPTASATRGNDWKKMKPSSFSGTINDVLRQCIVQARLSATDSLTPAKCDLLERKLQAGSCASVMVPDGVIFDFLQGQRDGKSTTSFNQVKALGREDRALLCDLDDGLYTYWFTGVANQSCNNLAVVLSWSPPVRASAPAPAMVTASTVSKPEPEKDTGKNCRFVKVEEKAMPSTFVGLQPAFTCDCFVPGVTAFVPGGTQSTSKYVCD